MKNTDLKYDSSVTADKVNRCVGCSVIIPCYNEEQNVEEVVRRIPAMGTYTEIIVVNDGSTDETADIVMRLKREHSNLKFIDYSPNRGKGFAVKRGFDMATQDVLMILDADMSVQPEELPRFFDLLTGGTCSFVSGARMIYPMQGKAMSPLKLFGNKFFAFIASIIARQRLTDVLCGTKALYKKDYRHIKMGRDRWGDLDLLFGAARLGNRIVEIPDRYVARRTGFSKMRPFRHGLHLLWICLRNALEPIRPK